MSTLCAIRIEACQHFYHCHVLCHKMFVACATFFAFYAKLNEIQNTIDFILPGSFFQYI